MPTGYRQRCTTCAFPHCINFVCGSLTVSCKLSFCSFDRNDLSCCMLPARSFEFHVGRVSGRGGGAWRSGWFGGWGLALSRGWGLGCWPPCLCGLVSFGVGSGEHVPVFPASRAGRRRGTQTGLAWKLCGRRHSTSPGLKKGLGFRGVGQALEFPGKKGFRG